MSTYLVAFVVSKFVHEAEQNSPLKVWSRPEAKSQTQYAQSIGLSVLYALGNFTQTNYFKAQGGEMQKLDMIAIPDFAAGAMENWGLLTYR